MAMNVGSSGRSGDPDVMIDINTTPLIDVMLVLLVMLIITIPIQLHSVNLNMPTGNPPPPLVKPEVVKIDIDPASVVYWNGEAVADRATLEEKMSAAAAQQVQPEVHLRPDKRAKYAIVAGVMASAQRLGLTKIGIVGSEQFVENE
jgi:biopolymer transport protein ExbD